MAGHIRARYVTLTPEDHAPRMSYSIILCKYGRKCRLLLLPFFYYCSITSVLWHYLMHLWAIQTPSSIILNYKLLDCTIILFPCKIGHRCIHVPLTSPNLINCQVHKGNHKWFPRLSLTTKISGQITAEIQESLARAARRKHETQPWFKKRRQTSPKQRGAAVSQFCKQGDANTNRLTRPTRSSLDSPSANVTYRRAMLTG